MSEKMGRIYYAYNEYRFQDRRRRYGVYMKNMGYKVYFDYFMNKGKGNQILVKTLKNVRPDIAWFLNFTFIKKNPEAVDYLRAKKVPIVVYSTYENSMKSFEDWLPVFRKVDFLFMDNIELHEFLVKNGLNSYHILTGFHPNQYFKIQKKKTMNISFCGTTSTKVPKSEDKRAMYVSSLKDFGIHVFGDSFQGRVKKGIVVHKYKTHKEQRRAYAQSWINLDLPFNNTKRDYLKNIYNVRNRFFEIPATGNFLMTVRCPTFLNVFDEDAVGYYDDNIESLRETVDRYLKDKKKMMEMAERAYQIVNEKHTFRHRFKQMFKIIRSSM